LALLASEVAAQPGQRGEIRGTVRDTLGLPVRGATILVSPGSRRTQSDSLGAFAVGNLGAGRHEVRVRRIGFRPHDVTLVLGAGERTNLDLVVFRLPLTLDTVVVRGERHCPRFTWAGYLCRRAEGRGRVIELEEIVAKEPIYTDDVFREMPGFRIEPRFSREGPTRVAISTDGWRCLVRLVNGNRSSASNPIPAPYDLMAVEIYRPDEMPPEYSQWMWQVVGGTRRNPYSGRCVVVNYWSADARRR
jgi:hypothetical protein